jgi:HEAT repeat protein
MTLLAWFIGCSPAPEDIAKAVASSNPVMREDGARLAQSYPDPVVESALVAVLADPAVTVRLNAVESLAEIEATTAGAALIDRLQNDEDPRMRRAAADALGRLKEKGAVPALSAYIATFTPDDREQLAAVWALGNIGAEGLDAGPRQATLDTLVSLRETTHDKWIRYQATAALRTLK